MVKLDAGHNDAALHCLPTGELVVIDAGRGTAERLTERVPPGSEIDHVPCTHPDEDHIKGMTDLLDDIDTEVHRSYHLPHFYVEKTDATRENDPPDEAYGAGNLDGLAGYLRSDTAVLRRFGEVVKETVDCSVEGIAGAESPVEGGEATILFPYAIREDVETLEDVDGEADTSTRYSHRCRTTSSTHWTVNRGEG